jgi:FixJ family two-component response regulator
MALPVREHDAVSRGNVHTPELTVAPGKRTVVWIVDDVESVRKSIAAVLETANMAVCDYASAADFLSAFRPGAVGCLVVDQNMPEMTGIELLQHLQHSPGAPPSIMITAQGAAQLTEKARAAGALAVVEKPVDADELIGLIEKVMLNSV